MSRSLRLAVFTDVHYGADVRDKMGTQAMRLLYHFERAVKAFRPDYIIDLGDRVSSINPDTDRRNMEALKWHYNRFAAPLLSVLGNHDVRNLTRQDNYDIMKNPPRSYCYEAGGFHLIFWSPRHYISESGLDLAERDIRWLRKALSRNRRDPVILFSHVPLDNQGEEGHEILRYFFWAQGEQVRAMLEEAGNVKMCLHGHVHQNRYHEINGIHYITLQSLVHQWGESSKRTVARAFALICADQNAITVSIRGKEPFVHVIPVRPRISGAAPVSVPAWATAAAAAPVA